MSATYSNKSRHTREPLSPKTIAVRLSVAIFGIALFFAIFVLPWLFTAGGR
jgi:hypothetical protein